MSKLIAALVIALTIIVTPISSNTLDDVHNAILMLNPNIPEIAAATISLVLLEEHERFETIDPLLMVAIAYCETGLQNVTGDNGASIGYFQIQKDAAEYICMYFDDIREQYDKLPYHEALLSDIELQTRIAFRYMYMMTTYWWDGNVDLAIASYQGGRGDTPYYRDVREIYDLLKGEID